MGESAKKARERQILNLVYASRRDITIECSERPDFTLRLVHDDVPFGVEVSDFYHSELLARLDRMPGYVAHLLDGGRVKHKDDRHAVGTITLMTATGAVVEEGIPAISQPIAKFDECVEFLAERIRAKDAKLESAFHVLRHVNLILCDRTSLLTKLEPEHFFAMCCPHSVCQALAGSRFREVYFATEFSNGPAVVPLKLLVALARLYTLKAVGRQPGVAFSECPQDLLRVFAADLAGASDGVWLHSDEGSIEILYGDCGFLLDADLGVRVHLYQDRAFPLAERVVTLPTSEFAASLRERLALLDAETTLVAPVAFPISAEEWRNVCNTA